VDNNVEFVSPGVLLLQTVIDPANPNYEICRQHLGALKSARDARGRRLEIIEVDRLPYTDAVHGGPHPAPCVNGYVINDAFLCPILDGGIDSAVHALLEKAYPNREIVPVPSTAISRDGGGIGCITQQQPAGPCASP
jgi:agmatine deiminase